LGNEFEKLGWVVNAWNAVLLGLKFQLFAWILIEYREAFLSGCSPNLLRNDDRTVTICPRIAALLVPADSTYHKDTVTDPIAP
jgi:hypothetical protein